ncbi:MAG: endopeptidase La [Acutalibacteraceae bacterium]|nr:endopeptidase La [Acutalibacteraceae bacterium]
MEEIKDDIKELEKLDKNLIEMPVLALRGIVVFPEMLLHFDVGRKMSALAIEKAMKTNQLIFVATQLKIDTDKPTIEDLYTVGVVAEVKQILRQPENIIRVVVEGKYRAKLISAGRKKQHLTGVIEPIDDIHDDEITELALTRSLKDIFEKYLSLVPKFPSDIVYKVTATKDAGKICDYIAANTRMEYEMKQEVLEAIDVQERLETLIANLTDEIFILEIEDSVHKMTRERIDENQREYYLREQLKVIESELNIDDESVTEIKEYLEKIQSLHLSENVEKVLVKECDKLSALPYSSQEANVIRNYLDTCLELPWNTFDEEIIDISLARNVLDKNHYGLTKVKDRILETLAVRKLSPDVKGQILCFVGPPGVGKTSIAQSIATAIKRKCQRIALGGVHDESEIRGHRRTYVGAMPGRIMNAVKLAETSNPVIILDEVDKLASDYKGDPTSALLEVLDGEQNHSFVDHYIDLPYDLSRVFFIATANDYSSIPEPLIDRMDIINVDSYTRQEKYNIATKHLLPKALKNSGIKASQFKITKTAMYDLIDSYTREAGVRNLERKINDLLRKTAVNIVEDENYKVSITLKNIEDFLGPRKYKPETVEKNDMVGVVNGLAWTAVGGTTLPIEVALLQGTGKIELTGSLGDVMKESAKIAISCARTMADKLKIDPEFYKKYDIHIHAPEGAVPKDGPSAGITMTTAIVSALTGKPVRNDVAMTGEITLRGRVLPIGGLKEKSMAAYRVGVKTVIIPEDNVSDLYEVDPVVKEAVEFKPVSSIEQVLEIALVQDKSVKDFSKGKASKKQTDKLTDYVEQAVQ